MEIKTVSHAVTLKHQALFVLIFSVYFFCYEAYAFCVFEEGLATLINFIYDVASMLLLEGSFYEKSSENALSNLWSLEQSSSKQSCR